MAKLKQDRVTDTDLVGYLAEVSSFSFEMDCLEFLSGTGFKCDRGGTYWDPVTNKPRQFDFRAQGV